MIPRSLRSLAAAVASLALGGALVTVPMSSPAGAATKPVIVAGVSQWGALARAVAGPDATVVSLLTDPNADPHNHEATTSDAANVARARIVIVNGAGYDTWLSKLVSARSGKVTTIDVAKLVHVATGKNPHLFYSVANAITFVSALERTLTKAGHYPGVVTRSNALLAQLRGLQASVTQVATSCHNVKVAATEDVAGYLLGAMKLNVVTPESLRLAVGNGVDPSIQDLATALNQLKAHPAFLIDNVQTATPLTNQMVAQARSSHVPVIKVTETMTGTSYVTWMRGVVSQIRAALVTKGCLK